MADKIKRIEMLIKKNISEIISFEVRNKSIGFVTVTDCKLSTDYQYCRVYVSFLGTNFPLKNLEELNKVKGFIKSSLAKRMDIYKVPNLEFLLDDSYETGKKIEELIKKEEKDFENFKK